jgi:hypothetical protein
VIQSHDERPQLYKRASSRSNVTARHFGYYYFYKLTDESLFDATRCLASTAILPFSLYEITGTVEHSESRVPIEGKMTRITRLQFYTRVDWTRPSQEVLCDRDESHKLKKWQKYINTIKGDKAQGGRPRGD